MEAVDECGEVSLFVCPTSMCQHWEGRVILSGESEVLILTLKRRSCRRCRRYCGARYAPDVVFHYTVGGVVRKIRIAGPLSVSEGPVLYKRREFNDLSQRQHPSSVEGLDLK